MPELPNLNPEIPIALFPVRLETRFRGKYLLLRVYPDDIHIDDFEPRLSKQEKEDAERYRELRDESPDAAWERLARRYGANRANWIIKNLDTEEVRPDDEVHTAIARALPDRWYAQIFYRSKNSNGTLNTFVYDHTFGEPVKQDLAISPFFNTADDNEEATDDENFMDKLWNGASSNPDTPSNEMPLDEIAWIFDFDKAVAVGMGTRIDLSKLSGTTIGIAPVRPQDTSWHDDFKIERVTVFGVRGSETGVYDASQLVEQLLSAQAHTEGLAFVPQGTPTNNTEDQKAGYASQDVTAPHQTDTSAPAPETNAKVLMDALGLGNDSILLRVAHSTLREQTDARHMNTALWRSTLGYYLQHQLRVGGVETLEQIRQHFIDYVRARGPLPALRVRRQPYGIIPVSTLKHWQPTEDISKPLAQLLRNLLPVWLSSADGQKRETVTGEGIEIPRGFTGVPRKQQVDKTTNPTEIRDTLMQVLAMSAHPTKVDGRLFASQEEMARLIAANDDQSISYVSLVSTLTPYAKALSTLLESQGIPLQNLDWLKLPLESFLNIAQITHNQSFEEVKSKIFGLLGISGEDYLTLSGVPLTRLLQEKASIDESEFFDNNYVKKVINAGVSYLNDTNVITRFLRTTFSDNTFTVVPPRQPVQLSSGLNKSNYTRLGEVESVFLLDGLTYNALTRLPVYESLAKSLDADWGIDAEYTNQAIISILYYIYENKLYPEKNQKIKKFTSLLESELFLDVWAEVLKFFKLTLSEEGNQFIEEQLSIVNELDNVPWVKFLYKLENPLSHEVGALNEVLFLLRPTHIQMSDEYFQERLQHLRERYDVNIPKLSRPLHPPSLLFVLLWRSAQLEFVEVAARGTRILNGTDYVFRELLSNPASPDTLVTSSDVTPLDTYTIGAYSKVIDDFLVSFFEAFEPTEASWTSIADFRKYGFHRHLSSSLKQSVNVESDELDELDEWLENLVAEFTPFWDAVESLVKLTDTPENVAKLELLLKETLGLVSYRFDAWVTSLVTKRLAENRQTQESGLAVGGYGWVEDLEERGSPISQGYIQAPSTDHATTAAVLRSGYLAHADSSPANEHPLATNLSSKRVRRALELLEGIRTGQPLGALLGYRLERTLHEQGDQHQLKVNNFIRKLRKAYPLVAGKLVSVDDGGAKKAVGPVNVVDGLALLRAYQDSPDIVSDLVRSEHQFTAPLKNALKELDDVIDAVGDLSIAESVYQIVKGNNARAGAALDALSRGEAPLPEFDVVRTPRSGKTLTHQLLMLSTDSPTVSDNWPETPRAKAAPQLNSWAAHLLGDPSQVWCTATSEQEANDGGVTRTEHSVSLADLGLAPLDLVALTATQADTPQQAELDLRVMRYLMPISPEPRRVEIDYDALPVDKEGVSLATLLVVADAVRQTFDQARPLSSNDLNLPENINENDTSTSEDTALLQRSKEAVCSLARAGEALRAALRVSEAEGASSEMNPLDTLRDFLTSLMGCPDALSTQHSLFDLSTEEAFLADFKERFQSSVEPLNAIKNALWQLTAFGIQGALPQVSETNNEATQEILLRQAYSVYKTFLAKLTRLDETPDINAQKRLEIVFGRGFKSLPRFTLPSESTHIFDYVQTPVDAQQSPYAWLHRAAHVRKRTATFLDTLDFAQVLQPESHLNLRVGQLPAEEGIPWTGLAGKIPDDGVGRLSFVAWSAETIPAGGVAGGPGIAGLLVDAWSEIIPNAEESTGLSLQYDAPGSKPPQAILLAVSPDNSMPWSIELLGEIVNESFDLAKARAVDTNDLLLLGHFLPTIHL